MFDRNIHPDDYRRRTAFASHLRGEARRHAIGREYVRLRSLGLRPFAIADVLGLTPGTCRTYGYHYRKALRDGKV